MTFAFAGTPEFGAWVLGHLLDLGRRPALVISQPDRPAGRRRTQRRPPVIERAAAADLEWVQTADINSDDLRDRLASAGAQTLVVAAFGQLLKAPLLAALSCVNVHASLLPAYRGAAPLNRVLMTGEDETGVCIMQMVAGLDEGPFAVVRRLSIGPRDDAGSLGRALALVGAQGVAQVLDGLQDGNVTWTEQQGAPSYAAKLTAADRPIDFSGTARRAHDQVRALAPDIGAVAELGGVRCTVWRSWPYGEPPVDAPPAAAAPVVGRPGRVVGADGRLFCGCRDGVLELLAVQPAGKRTMRAAEFLRGYGTRLVPQADLGADSSPSSSSKE